jgi:hypothetical protein
VFVIVIVADVATGLLALFVLKKLRANYIKGEMKTAGAVPVAAE